MSQMTEEKARGIIRTKDYQSFTMINSASCYLEAIEKAKGLVEALEYIVKLGMVAESKAAKFALMEWEKEK